MISILVIHSIRTSCTALIIVRTSSLFGLSCPGSTTVAAHDIRRITRFTSVWMIRTTIILKEDGFSVSTGLSMSTARLICSIFILLLYSPCKALVPSLSFKLRSRIFSLPSVCFSPLTIYPFTLTSDSASSYFPSIIYLFSFHTHRLSFPFPPCTFHGLSPKICTFPKSTASKSVELRWLSGTFDPLSSALSYHLSVSSARMLSVTTGNARFVRRNSLLLFNVPSPFATIPLFSFSWSSLSLSILHFIPLPRHMNLEVFCKLSLPFWRLHFAFFSVPVFSHRSSSFLRYSEYADCLLPRNFTYHFWFHSSSLSDTTVYDYSYAFSFQYRLLDQWNKWNFFYFISNWIG